MDNIEKWQYCVDHECYNCGRIIYDIDVEEEELVTSCPYCNTNFVE